MAYSRNFDSEASGAISNFASGILSGSAVFTIDDTVYFGNSGKSLKLSNNSANIGHNWQYDSASELKSGDGTYKAKFRLGTVNDGSACRVGLLLRGNSGGTTGYVAMIRPQAANTTIRLSRYSVGTETAITTADYGSQILADTWYHMKVYMSGTTIQIRVWKDRDAEPGTWLIDTTDATYDNTNKKTGYFYFTSVASLRVAHVDSIEEEGSSLSRQPIHPTHPTFRTDVTF